MAAFKGRADVMAVLLINMASQQASANVVAAIVGVLVKCEQSLNMDAQLFLAIVVAPNMSAGTVVKPDSLNIP